MGQLIPSKGITLFKGFVCGILSIFSVLSTFAQLTTDAFTTVGNQTWTVPQGVTSVTVEAWGGGGGGGGTLSHVLPYSSPRAGGGGGGAYSQVTLSVNPGDILTIDVGTGGTGGNGNSDGIAGGTSSVTVSGSIVVSAAGGQGGAYRTSNNDVGVATGLGGASGVGFMFAGGNGGPDNYDSNGAGGGGAAGSTEAGTDGTTTLAGIGGVVGGGDGGNPTTVSDENGHSGIAPGGGGSGSRTTLLQGSNQGGEGARGEIRVTYCLVPDQPDIIVGEVTSCEGMVQNYSVTADPDAASYVWTLPADWSGSSSTSSIALMTGSNSGVITVEAVNQCGTSDPQTMTVSITPLPNQPSVISGNAALCSGDSETFSVVNDPSVDTYIWTIPTGWTGSSAINEIAVTAAENSGAITVVSQNSCGTSPVRILNVVSADVPAQPSVINGSNLTCQGETVAYAVTADPLVDDYVWTFPADWSGSGTTHSIGLTIGAMSGVVSVSAENQCGTSSPQVLNVTVNPVTNEITQSGGTLTATQTGAVYQWIDCATGAPIGGAGSQSYTPLQNGEYSVLIITPENCTVVSECIVMNNLNVGHETFTSMSVYPNPAADKVVISNIPSESTVRLLDMTGKVVYAGQTNSTLKMDLTDVKAGVYLLTVENKKGSTTQKLIVKK